MEKDLLKNETKGGVPPLNEDRVAILEKYGITISAIEPMGARVEGLDLKTKSPPDEVLKAL